MRILEQCQDEFLFQELVGFLDGVGRVGLGIVKNEEKIQQLVFKNIFVFGQLVVIFQ